MKAMALLLVIALAAVGFGVPADVIRPVYTLDFIQLDNLRFLLDLTAGARAAIEAGRLADFKREALAGLTPEAEEVVWSP